MTPATPQTQGGCNLATTAVIIPALNEADNLRVLLPQLNALGLGQIIVCDNGSPDATRAVIQSQGALEVHEAGRGDGAAGVWDVKGDGEVGAGDWGSRMENWGLGE